jgi:methylmalonyl-CoA/ethylmalonyl-CoA epimerase
MTPDEFANGHRLGRINHVAILVRDLDAALLVYRDALGLPLQATMPVPSDGVRIAFLPVGDSKIELVQPTEPGTGIARYLESKGEGIHHVCFEVPDLVAALARLDASGIQLIDRAPRKGAEGPVAFIHPKACNGVLVELIEVTGGPAWDALKYAPGEAIG